MLCCGNVGGVAKVNDLLTVAQSEPESTYHMVEKGDTLSAIADFLYGDPTAYRRIVRANPGLDPDALAIGQELVLPLPTRKGS